MAKKKEYTLVLSEVEAYVLRVYAENELSIGLTQLRSMERNGKTRKSQQEVNDAHKTVMRKLQQLPENYDG